MSETESSEYRGIWWIPDNQQRTLHGTLTFSQGTGGILELDGWFKDITGINTTLQPEIILGLTKDGKKITLYKNIEKSTTHNVPGLPVSFFSTLVIFEGVHFSEPSNIRFKNISMLYSYIDDWLNIHAFSFGDWMYKKPGEDKELTITYSLPKPIQAQINEDYRLNIVFRPKLEGSHSGQRFAGITQRVFVEIRFSKEKEYEEIMMLSGLLRDFFSLAVLESIRVLNLEAGSSKANLDLPIKIFSKSANLEISPKQSSSSNILFGYDDIAERFEYVMRKWFENAEVLKPVYDLYFSALHSSGMYLHHKFLNFIQALEAYHRRVIGGNELPDKDHEKRILEILGSTPDHHKKWLQEELKYSNELSLRKRLKVLLDIYSDVMSLYIADMSDFTNKVVDTRNYMTHYDQSLKEKAAINTDLWKIVKKLEILVQVCLLTELGFTKEQIKDLFQRSQHYKFMTQEV